MHSSNLWLQYFESRYVCLFEMLSTYMYAEDGTLVKRKKSMLCSNAIFFVLGVTSYTKIVHADC